MIFRVDGGAPLQTQIQAAQRGSRGPGTGSICLCRVGSAQQLGQDLRLAIGAGPSGARKYRPWASVRAGDPEAAGSAGNSFERRCARPDC